MPDMRAAALGLMCLAAMLLPGCASPVTVNQPATVAAETVSPVTSFAPTPSPQEATASPMTASSPTTSPTPAETATATPTPAPKPTAAATAKPQTKSPAATAKKKPPHQQAVVVIASGTSAKVSLYEWDGGAWKELVKTTGCVGRNGLSSDHREGDGTTPRGVYTLNFVFGTEKPETKMKFRAITDESYWVDDPESEYYNSWQEGDKGWKSAEKLSDYPKHYHYAVSTSYNAEREPYKGSAIFLHCKVKSYTSGCVAVPESALLKMLKRLDPAKKPVIIIDSGKKAVENYGIVDIP